MNNIAVLMGGLSNEHKISIKSGNFLIKNISNKFYNIYRVVLSEKGFLCSDEKNKIKYSINEKDFSIIKDNKKVKFNLIFNVIHGDPGENGKIKAYFDIIRIPCVGTDFLNSAITFNKKICKSIIKGLNIDTPKYFFLKKNNFKKFEKKINKLSIPYIIKPNNRGSSLGVSVVYKKQKKSKILKYINKAFKEDNEIIIEEFIDGKEISVGLIEYNNSIKLLPITEIITKKKFFNYNMKYNGIANEITPARLNNNISKTIKKISLKIYNNFKIKVFSRLDYIIRKNKIYFLEINTIPGLTNKSILPKQIKKAKIDIKKFINYTIENNIKNIY